MTAKQKADFLTESEQALLLHHSNPLQKQQLGFRLSQEAVDIIDAEARRYDVDRTKALEILLREFQRKLRKSGK